MMDEIPKEQWPEFAKLVPLNRLGRPEEIAQGVLYLASDQSSFVTGSTLKVDGGFSKFQ